LFLNLFLCVIYALNCRCVCSEEAYHDRTTEVYPFTVPPLVFSSLKVCFCLMLTTLKLLPNILEWQCHYLSELASTSPKKKISALESGGTSLEVVFGVQRWSFIIIADDVTHSLTDNWGSVDCSINWIGITAVLAMCWGTWIGTAVVLLNTFENHLIIFFSYLILLLILNRPGCQWLWSRACCIWIFHSSLYSIWSLNELIWFKSLINLYIDLLRVANSVIFSLLHACCNRIQKHRWPHCIW